MNAMNRQKNSETYRDRQTDRQTDKQTASERKYDSQAVFLGVLCHVLLRLLFSLSVHQFQVILRLVVVKHFSQRSFFHQLVLDT